MFNQDNNEQFVTLTEQGNFGLGIGHITNEEEKNKVKYQINKQDQNNTQNNNSFNNYGQR